MGVESKKLGVNKVFSSENSQVDVIFIHGVDPSRFVWSSSNKPEDSWVSWLADEVEDIDIFMVEYDISALLEVDGLSNISSIASILKEALFVQNIGKRDFFIIAYSLGGMIAKELFRVDLECADNKLMVKCVSLHLVSVPNSKEECKRLMNISSTPLSRFISLTDEYISLVNRSIIDEGNSNLSCVNYYESLKGLGDGVVSTGDNPIGLPSEEFRVVEGLDHSSITKFGKVIYSDVRDSLITWMVNKNIDENFNDEDTFSDGINVFISYSRNDQDHLYELHKSLAPIKNSKEFDISIWDDRNLVPGCNWSESIVSSLDSSDIFLCLISRDFISSKSCLKELNYAKNNNKLIIPIMLRECFWDELGLSKVQAIPRSGWMLADNSFVPDRVWSDVAKEIFSVINNVREEVISNQIKILRNEFNNSIGEEKSLHSVICQWLDESANTIIDDNFDKMLSKRHEICSIDGFPVQRGQIVDFKRHCSNFIKALELSVYVNDKKVVFDDFIDDYYSFNKGLYKEFLMLLRMDVVSARMDGVDILSRKLLLDHIDYAVSKI